ncbi:MAG: glycosyltransferase, partial [Chitinophagaceae bacterium]
PCSADLGLFDPSKIDSAQKTAYRQRLNIKDDDFIVTYLGSIGGWYLTAEMLRFCKLLSDKIPAARFLFISPHRHEQIIAAASEHNISPEKIITVKASRQEVPTLLSFSTYSLFFIKPCYSKLSSSPTKHGELMAMGIPVISNGGVGDMQSIVEGSNGGFIVDDFSDNAFNKVIDQIQRGQSFSPSEIRQKAKEIYSLEKAVKAYTRIYSKILGS